MIDISIPMDNPNLLLRKESEALVPVLAGYDSSTNNRDYISKCSELVLEAIETGFVIE